MRKRAVVRLLFPLTLALLLSWPPHPGLGQPEWPTLTTELFASGFSQPTVITHPGDGSERLFVVERRGMIQIVDASGTTAPEPFLDIQARVRDSGSEEGLLGLAFPPGFGSVDHFYVYYTDLSGDNVLARYRLSGDPNRADPDSEEILLYFDHPTYANHNGGHLAFGPDGYLYVATGDGGGAGDPQGNAQDLGSLLGKLLRLDVEIPDPEPEGAVSDGNSTSVTEAPYHLWLPVIARQVPEYRIPPDNPFVGDPDARDEIWAYGLRNPWRFSFDRESGDLFIGDVGQASWEEIDYQPADSSGGLNFGWNIMEGAHCYNASSCDTTGLTLPIAEYPSEGECAVTGGYFYRGPDEATMQGIYFFADYCSGRIWGLQLGDGDWAMQELLDTPYFISTFGEDEAGELYLSDYAGGAIYRLIESP